MLTSDYLTMQRKLLETSMNYKFEDRKIFSDAGSLLIKIGMDLDHANARIEGLKLRITELESVHPELPSRTPYGNDKPMRLQVGEAYMMCNDCGAKLYSFDGDFDASISCPYRKHCL